MNDAVPDDSRAPLPRIGPWTRAVVKVGSALVAPDGQGPSARHLGGIAQFVMESQRRGREIVVVSSGAVAAGRATQPSAAARPRSIAEKQALAALGQPLLMAHWSRLIDRPCAQVLLTHDDLQHRQRFLNARTTLAGLLALGALPIVNENDTVAVEEIKVGDNDNLAAHVAALVGADLLVICTDIDGLYDADPRTTPGARLVPVVERIDARIRAMAGGANDASATGGMRTKVEAAEKATARGIDTVVVSGTRAAALAALHDGMVDGTLFRRSSSPLDARKHWMRHALAPSGRILVDAGAAAAIAERGASLLPSGIVGVEGRFERGDAVEIVADGSGEIVARGLSQYGAHEVARIRGHRSDAIASVLGYAHTAFVVHRDDLVLAG